MKKIIGIVAAIGIMAFALAACSNSGQTATTEAEEEVISSSVEIGGLDDDAEGGSELVGVWKHGSYAYTFNEDGTGDYGEGFEFTYVDNGDTVTITYNESGAENEFKYSISGDKLLIEDSFGEEIEYTK